MEHNLFSMLAAGVVLGLSAGLSPGPLMALLLSESLANGPRAGLKVACAPLLTDLPIIAASVWLLAELGRHQAILGAVSLAGAAFMAVLAWGSLFRSPGPVRPDLRSRALSKGMAANFLNPHPYLFWLTIGSPLLVKAASQGLWPPVGFLAGFYVCIVGAKAVLAVAAGRSRGLVSGPIQTWILRGLGLALAVFAVILARDGLILWGLWSDS